MKNWIMQGPGNMIITGFGATWLLGTIVITIKLGPGGFFLSLLLLMAVILGAIVIGLLAWATVAAIRAMKRKPCQAPRIEEGYPQFYTGEKDADGSDSIHPHYTE